jgi:hypothetical protein
MSRSFVMNAKAEASTPGALTPAPRNLTSASVPRALATDPLSVDDILTGFYRPERPGRSAAPAGASAVPVAPAVNEAPQDTKKPRPTHYKVVCISLYNEDIERLDRLVQELKRRGHSKANKSQVIREALLQIDLDKVPRSH